MHPQSLAVVFAALAVLLAPPLRAQVVPHAVTVPKVLTGSFGNQDFSYIPQPYTQYSLLWIRADQLPPVGYQIVAISLRNTPRRASQATSYLLQIHLEHTTVGFGGINPSVMANLVTPTMVFNQVINLPAIAAATNPNLALQWMPLLAPFVVGTSNLFYVETLNQQGTGNGNQWVDGMLMNTVQTLSLASGGSCGGLLQASYLAPTFNLQVGALPPLTPVHFMLGTENAWWGALRLPIDLGPLLGWTGCALGIAPLLDVVVTADGAGVAQVSFPYVLPLSSVVISAQALHLTNSNSWATTNVATTILGNAGLINAVYNGPSGNGGPWSYNAGYPLLLR